LKVNLRLVFSVRRQCNCSLRNKVKRQPQAGEF
jgi:hypothetical protein